MRHEQWFNWHKEKRKSSLETLISGDMDKRAFKIRYNVMENFGNGTEKAKLESQHRPFSVLCLGATETDTKMKQAVPP